MASVNAAGLAAAGRDIVFDAVDKELNEDSRNQGTDKSYPQPERISPHGSQSKYKNAQKTHGSGEKSF
jgi:hypothetical protein